MNRYPLTIIHTFPGSFQKPFHKSFPEPTPALQLRSVPRPSGSRSAFTPAETSNPAESSRECLRIQGLDYHGRRRGGPSTGDFVDFISHTGASLSVCMGAASAHSSNASRMAAGLQTLVYGLSTPAVVRPASIAGALNQSVCGAAGNDSYATLFYACVDSLRRELCYVNAGHEPALLLRKRQSRAITLQSTGAILGLTHRSSYGQRTIPLEPGDVLAVFSEGLAEAVDILGRPFGSAGVLSVLRRYECARAADLVEEILDAAERHAGWGAPSADQTVAVVRFTGGMDKAIPAEAETELAYAVARAS
jgi:sigma-B regulation protein RsbU (phosphoserine phosphatase)